MKDRPKKKKKEGEIRRNLFQRKDSSYLKAKRVITHFFPITVFNSYIIINRTFSTRLNIWVNVIFL